MMTIETRWHAVRCCCESTKIFGFLKLPATVGRSTSVDDRNGQAHKIQLRESCELTAYTADILVSTRMPVPALASREAELAVYSEDRPLEFWRTIPDFVEAKT